MALIGLQVRFADRLDRVAKLQGSEGKARVVILLVMLPARVLPNCCLKVAKPPCHPIGTK